MNTKLEQYVLKVFLMFKHEAIALGYVPDVVKKKYIQMADSGVSQYIYFHQRKMRRQRLINYLQSRVDRTPEVIVPTRQEYIAMVLIKAGKCTRCKPHSTDNMSRSKLNRSRIEKWNHPVRVRPPWKQGVDLTEGQNYWE